MPALPRHLAVIMDGNGRWARQRRRPRVFGHQAGVKATRRLVEHSLARGIPHLTLFAFSSENWQRPDEEVQGLMQLFMQALEQQTPELKKAGVRLHFVGNLERFSPALQQRMQQAEAQTEENHRLQLHVALNYGGRWDILQAVEKLLESGLPVNEENLTAHLAMAGIPDPDLIIRTSGEQRLSNFLLWQGAYSELWFTPVLWPDFSESHLDEALQWYAGRQRRFGQTAEQLTATPGTTHRETRKC